MLNDLLSDLPSLIGVLSLISTAVIFLAQQVKSNKINKMAVYQQLEIASIDLFRYESDNIHILLPFQSTTPAATPPTEENSKIFENYIFQTMNLFEMATKHRKQKMIEPDVFGSWVKWFYDILLMHGFRDIWPEIKFNYTKEVRDLFDEAVANFDFEDDENKRLQDFFQHAGDVINCATTRNWTSSSETYQS